MVKAHDMEVQMSRRKRHTEEQIISILKKHDAGMTTADLCREQEFFLNVRKRERRFTQVRLELPRAIRPNERWSMDFIQGILRSGRPFRMLCVIDQLTKECPVIEADYSINGLRVSRVLECLTLTRGRPEAITVDNGPEFAGIILDRWAYKNNVKLDFIRPGKPIENATSNHSTASSGMSV
jgi:putative transposase